MRAFKNLVLLSNVVDGEPPGGAHQVASGCAERAGAVEDRSTASAFAVSHPDSTTVIHSTLAVGNEKLKTRPWALEGKIAVALAHARPAAFFRPLVADENMLTIFGECGPMPKCVGRVFIAADIP
jgi:hypothetical protein